LRRGLQRPSVSVGPVKCPCSDNDAAAAGVTICEHSSLHRRFHRMGDGQSVEIPLTPQVLLITCTLPHRIAIVLVRSRLKRSGARDDVGFKGSRRDYASALTTSIIPRGMCSCRNSMSLVVSGAFRQPHTVPLLVTAVDSR
jgi:hypothetical protein